jgi:hypothetical protein
MSSYYLRNGLTDAVFARSHSVLREALGGGRQLLRKEIAAALARGRVATDGLKLRFLLLQAELDLVVCSGALRGKHQTFALVDELVPPAPPIPEDAALAELARRYFASHGPATLKDFMWWSSLTAAQARHGLELLKGKELRRLEAGGRIHWMLDIPARRSTDRTPVHLLQAFDEYIIGYTESRKVLAVAGWPDTPSSAPLHSHVLIRDGQLLGFWRAVPEPEEVLVEVHLARPLDRASRSALEDELERYGRFLELPVRLARRTAGSRRSVPKRKA